MWGFKEPRSLFTIQGWLDVVPDATLVGIFRHPSLVASSLETRDRMPRRKALRLWLFYNLRLHDLWSRTPFPIVEFTQNSEDFRKQLDHLVRLFGLEPTQEFREFLEHDHRHETRFRIDGLDTEILTLYDNLRLASLGSSPIPNSDPGRVIVGGVGGSGARVVSQLLQGIGYRPGDHLNASHDNLWFSFLFNRRTYTLRPRSSWDSRSSILSARLLARLMDGEAQLTDEDWPLLVAALQDHTRAKEGHIRRGEGQSRQHKDKWAYRALESMVLARSSLATLVHNARCGDWWSGALV